MRNKPFGYCLNTSTVKGSELKLEALVDLTAKAGYDAIEPWVKELDAYTAAGGSLTDLGKRIRDQGLGVANLIGFFEWAVPDQVRRQQALAEARRCFAMAQALSCPLVAAPPMGLTEATGVDLLAMAERYGELIRVARAFGVVPVLEFWGFSRTLQRLGEALLVAGECGEPEACVLADVYHLHKGGSRAGGLRLLGPTAVGLFHLNDYPASPGRDTITDADRVYPGDGVAPLTAILSSLYRIGYRGMLSLELFNVTYWRQDPLAVARTGLAKAKAAVAAALAST